ncbi:hypothetical protein ACI65C_013378 [Semiaphis heraclei]
MYNEQHFRNKLTIHKFREVLVDKLLELKPTSLRVSNSEQPLENRFQRRQIIKHKLEETEEKCSRNRKKRKREALNKAKKVKPFAVFAHQNHRFAYNVFKTI